jgi:hypothetical protein
VVSLLYKTACRAPRQRALHAEEYAEEIRNVRRLLNVISSNHGRKQ